MSLYQENLQLKKDLDFATIEIERLRAKLIIEDFEMPPLSDELFGMNLSKERPIGLGAVARDLSCDNSDRNNSEFFSLKEAITQSASNTDNVASRNNGQRQNVTTQSSSFIGKPVPKLDFKRLKKVQEFKDWYQYATKLEDSVKYLRTRVRDLEEDNNQLNLKFRKE